MYNLDNQIQFSKAPPKRLATEINYILDFKSDTQRYDTDVHIEHEDILKRYTYMYSSYENLICKVPLENRHVCAMRM